MPNDQKHNERDPLTEEPATSAAQALCEEAAKALGNDPRACWDLSIAAIHEAGHSVVATFLGHLAQPRVYVNPERADDQKLWVGSCEIRAGRISGFAKRHRRLIGVAGYVAELILEGIVEPWDIHELLCLNLDDLSESDQDYIGTNFSRRDIQATVDILLERWGEVVLEAGWLVKMVVIEGVGHK